MQVTFVPAENDSLPTIKISLENLSGNREEILEALDVVHKDFKRVYANYNILVKCAGTDTYILG